MMLRMNVELQTPTLHVMNVRRYKVCIHIYARLTTMSHMYVSSMHDFLIVMYCDAGSRHHWKWFMRHY